MTEAPCLRIHSFLSTGSGICIGKKRIVVFVRKRCAGGHGGQQGPPRTAKGNAVYRRYAHGCDQGVGPRRSCPRRGGTAPSRVRERGGRAPPKRAGSRPRSQPGRLPHPSPGSAPLPRLIADRAYDGDAFRAWLAQRGIGWLK